MFNSHQYFSPEASAYRAGMGRHYVKCAGCENDVCGTYAQHGEDEVYNVENPVRCRYLGDNCFPGAKYDDGVYCHYCR
jgi:hypothetical protein